MPKFPVKLTFAVEFAGFGDTVKSNDGLITGIPGTGTLDILLFAIGAPDFPTPNIFLVEQPPLDVFFIVTEKFGEFNSPGGNVDMVEYV
ncbi:hypothetical protein FACS189434_14250 [Bacteroidia bacterium]|nr:hypothetical protein FACS189434_14250 [Bacteroidia bacterium]